MSLKARLTNLAESVEKSRRGEVWLQTEDGLGYERLGDPDPDERFFLTADELELRRITGRVTILKFDQAPARADS